MKLSFVALILSLSSAQAFAPPKMAAPRSTKLFDSEYSRYDIDNGRVVADILSTRPEPILADVSDYDWVDNGGYAVNNGREPVVGFADAIDPFMAAFEELLVKVSLKAEERLAKIAAKKAKRVTKAMHAYEKQVVAEAKKAEATVAARKLESKDVDKSMEAYERQLALATRSVNELRSVEKDEAGMSAYQAQLMKLTSAVRQTTEDLAPTSDVGTSSIDKAMAAYEKQLAAATRTADEEIARIADKRDQQIDRAMAAYEKQLMAATRKTDMGRTSKSVQEDGAGMADYDAQLTAAVSMARQVTSPFEVKAESIFRYGSGDYLADLSNGAKEETREYSSSPSSKAVANREETYGDGMAAYEAQLNAQNDFFNSQTTPEITAVSEKRNGRNGDTGFKTGDYHSSLSSGTKGRPSKRTGRWVDMI